MGLEDVRNDKVSNADVHVGSRHKARRQRSLQLTASRLIFSCFK
jgi:hypothetical protein